MPDRRDFSHNFISYFIYYFIKDYSENVDKYKGMYIFLLNSWC